MIPENIRSVLKRLNDAGYEAYLVGGCVRDALIGREVSDYDITTSAMPREVEEVFSGFRVIETGIKHGTVTVLVDSSPIEITTFRTDGEYSDHRHPDGVSFTRSIEEDLARRDFTMNSIAMDASEDLIDPYGGKKDLAAGLIRCTGDPDTRFNEDALRIMRALRFSSTLGFEIEEKTSESIKKNKDLLSDISVERVFSELKKLLCGKDVFRVLTEYPEVICAIIPELAPAVGFEHNNRYHMYDVYTHIAKTVENIEPDETLRLVMLLHDVGKPYSYTEDETGYRRYHGHPDVSADIARDRLAKMHSDGETARLVTLLCKHHDRTLTANRRSVKRLFLTFSYDEIVMLCKVQIADSAAHAPLGQERGVTAKEVLDLADEIVREGECLTLKDLAVDGNDLKSLGYSGKEIGGALREVLSLVVDEELANEKEAITEYLKNKKENRENI